MIKENKIAVIIPAINEEESLPSVLRDIPNFVDEVIVVDNGSSDNTIKVAKENGASVLSENERGYGAACLRGIDYLADKNFAIVVFIDGDYSDFPEEMNLVIEPIINENYDMVIGSRMIGNREKGAMLPQALFGNWLATFLINLFWKYKFTDLGPFRAIKYQSLLDLNMIDRNFGWTVEMQIKAAKQKLNCTEVPVKYRKRIGTSKVTGTLSGTIKASYKILFLIFAGLFDKKNNS